MVVYKPYRPLGDQQHYTHTLTMSMHSLVDRVLIIILTLLISVLIWGFSPRPSGSLTSLLGLQELYDPLNLATIQAAPPPSLPYTTELTYVGSSLFPVFFVTSTSQALTDSRYYNLYWFLYLPISTHPGLRRHYNPHTKLTLRCCSITEVPS